MLYFFKVLLLLINIDQETVLNWFGVESPTNRNTFSKTLESNSVNLLNNEVEPAPAISFETLRLIVEELGNKVQDGLTLADIENILFFHSFYSFHNSSNPI